MNIAHLLGLATAVLASVEKADSRCTKDEAMRACVETYRRAWDHYNTGNFPRMALSFQPGAQFQFSPDPGACTKLVSLDLLQSFRAAYDAGDRAEYMLKAVEWDEYERTVKIRSTSLHGPMGTNLTAVDTQVYFSADYGCNYKAYLYVAMPFTCL